MAWLPAAIGGAVEGGSTISNYLGSRKRGKPPSIMDFQWPNTGALQGDVSQTLLDRIGNPRQYQYNPDFEIPQPAIEAQTENLISNRLGNLPSANTYKAQVEAAKKQDIAREKEATTQQADEEKNMYNRLGLVSSTPWLNRFGEIGDESLMRQGDISGKYDMFGLNYGLASDKLVEDIINQRTTQGQVLGQAQRGYNQYPIGMSYQDLIRQAEEEQGYIGLGNQYLGMGAATPMEAYGSRLFQWQQPNQWDWLAAGARNTWSGMGMGG